MKKIDSHDIFVALYVSIMGGGPLGILIFFIQFAFEVIPNLTDVVTTLLIIPITIICFMIVMIFNLFSKKQKESINHEIRVAKKEKENQQWEIEKKKYEDLYFNLIKELKAKFKSYGEVLSLSKEFEKLLSEMEHVIIKIDKKEKTNYIQQFVKISNFISRKNKIIESTYYNLIDAKEIINTDGNEYEIEKDPILESESLPNKIKKLESNILLYQEMIFHAISMVTALTSNKMILFYQIYEIFDHLGIFENNWQSKVSGDLKKINKKLDQIDRNIRQGFEQLTYTVDSSFSELEKNIIKELEKINSNISFNNLLNSVQTYKLYQIREDTNRLSKK